MQAKLLRSTRRRSLAQNVDVGVSAPSRRRRTFAPSASPGNQVARFRVVFGAKPWAHYSAAAASAQIVSGPSACSASTGEAAAAATRSSASRTKLSGISRKKGSRWRTRMRLARLTSSSRLSRNLPLTIYAPSSVATTTSSARLRYRTTSSGPANTIRPVEAYGASWVLLASASAAPLGNVAGSTAATAPASPGRSAEAMGIAVSS